MRRACTGACRPGQLILALALALLASCGDQPERPRVDFAITHTDQLELEGSSPLDLPPEPAVVEGGAATVDAHGVIAAPDACDDLGAELEPGDSLLTLRVIVRGSRTHPDECGDPGTFALFQWRANVHPVDPGTQRVRVLYDYRGLRSHRQNGASRDPYPDRVVVDRAVLIR
jgi:hypothetical protein